MMTELDKLRSQCRLKYDDIVRSTLPQLIVHCNEIVRLPCPCQLVRHVDRKVITKPASASFQMAGGKRRDG